MRNKKHQEIAKFLAYHVFISNEHEGPCVWSNLKSELPKEFVQIVERCYQDQQVIEIALNAMKDEPLKIVYETVAPYFEA